MKYFESLFVFIKYLKTRFFLFYVVFFLTFWVLTLEYAATSLMIPLAPAVSSRGGIVVDFWMWSAGFLGFTPEFRVWLWIFLLLMGLRLILGYVLAVLTTVLGKKVHFDLSRRIFSHVLNVESMSTVYTKSVGHYISLAGDDTFKSGTLVASFFQALVGGATSLVGLLVLYQFSESVFYWVIIFLIISLLLVTFMVRWMGRLNSSAIECSRDAGTMFVESLNSLRSLRTLHAQQFISTEYSRQIKNYLLLLVKIDAIKSGIKVFPAVVLVVFSAFLLRPGQEVSTSESMLLAGTVIIGRVFASLGQLATAVSQVLTDIKSLGDIASLAKLSLTEKVDENGSPLLDSINAFDLRDVSFYYSDGTQVLNKVNFEFRKGRTYAIIGPSGSGKSTLADLMLGLARPTMGEIRINSANLDDWLVGSKVLLVEQQPKIFSSTIRDNLSLGFQASDEEIWEALSSVNLYEVVKTMPAGLDTMLTYQGENFSGGQRQRLGIARALIRKPEVLLLDEATSALDPANRSLVVKNLRKKMSGKIIIFITHDREIADLADEVLEVKRD
jgi:ABC-type bacteriocin/lantibiotic exporter with double-glycine peptidase domain